MVIPAGFGLCRLCQHHCGKMYRNNDRGAAGGQGSSSAHAGGGVGWGEEALPNTARIQGRTSGRITHCLILKAASQFGDVRNWEK